MKFALNKRFYVCFVAFTLLVSMTSCKSSIYYNNLVDNFLGRVSNGNKTRMNLADAGQKNVTVTNKNSKALKNQTAAGVKGSDTTGKIVEGGHVIADPWIVTKCNQVVQVEAKQLPDPSNFFNKKSAFLTMSAYMINMFDEKNSNTLKESISMDKMLHKPNILPGSVSCINFQGEDKRIIVCPENMENAEKLLKAYETLMKCRLGDNLANVPAATIKNILSASCLGLNVNFNLKKFGNDLNKAKAAMQTSINTALANASERLNQAVVAKKTGPTAVQQILDGKK